MRFAVASAMLLFIWANHAAADLYRWVDPETGSVKFSSYPPPWYGDAAKQRRAPKVEQIPAGKTSPATLEEPFEAQRPAAIAQAGKVPEELEARRKAMLQEISRLPPQSGIERGAQALHKQLEAYAAVSGQIDKLDPRGAAARRGELQLLVEKIIKGEPR